MKDLIAPFKLEPFGYRQIHTNQFFDTFTTGQKKSFCHWQVDYSLLPPIGVGWGSQRGGRGLAQHVTTTPVPHLWGNSERVLPRHNTTHYLQIQK